MHDSLDNYDRDYQQEKSRDGEVVDLRDGGAGADISRPRNAKPKRDDAQRSIAAAEENICLYLFIWEMFGNSREDVE